MGLVWIHCVDFLGGWSGASHAWKVSCKCLTWFQASMRTCIQPAKGLAGRTLNACSSGSDLIWDRLLLRQCGICLSPSVCSLAFKLGSTWMTVYFPWLRTTASFNHVSAALIKRVLRTFFTLRSSHSKPFVLESLSFSCNMICSISIARHRLPPSPDGVSYLRLWDSF